MDDKALSLTTLYSLRIILLAMSVGISFVFSRAPYQGILSFCIKSFSNNVIVIQCEDKTPTSEQMRLYSFHAPKRRTK